MNGFRWQRKNGFCRFFVIFVWAAVVSSPTLAQTRSSKDVVSLEARFSKKQVAPGDTVDLLIDYSTKPNWYIYSPDNKSEYSKPTTIQVSGDFLSANGTLSFPEPDEKTILDETYRALHGKGTFRSPQRIKAETTVGSHTAQAIVSFMACNSVDMTCLAPAAVTVKATVVLAGSPSAATTEVAGDGSEQDTIIARPESDSAALFTKPKLDLFKALGSETLGGADKKPTGPKATFQLSIEPKELSATATGKLKVSYSVIDGHHIYAPDNEVTPTTVVFDPDVIVLDGKPSYSREPTVKEQFGVVSRELHGEGTFELPFRLKGRVKVGALTFNATATYVACTEEFCFPSVTTDPMPLKVQVAEEKISLLDFLLLAIGAGLLTLIMPCTYPMIPITVSYFTKQAEARHGAVLPIALTYGAGIVLIFVAIGVLVGPAISVFAVHGALNLIFGLLFVLFALVLFGAVEIRLPSSLMSISSKGAQAGGYLGVFVLGATLVVTSFTCTAPFVGSLLAVGAAGGERTTPEVALGMAVFGLTMAIPFVGLALFPTAVKKMPKSGEWMQTLKVTFGFLELAAALKFFSIAEYYYEYGILPRELFFALWAIIAFVTGLYLLGMVPLKAAGPVSIGPRQMVLGLVVLMFGAYCLFGTAGHRLDQIMMGIAPPYASGEPLPWEVEFSGDEGAETAAASKHAEKWTLVKDDFDKGIAKALAEKKLALINWTGKF